MDTETLPVQFVTKMRSLLGKEFSPFLSSYSAPRTYGLRVNTLKLDKKRFMDISPFLLKQIPWVEEGFYYSGQDRPGKHPYHAAGLYYIQEPSAMAAGVLLDPRPGEKVLDLCAAPGGKSTHIGARMQGQGLLVANEYVSSRAKILAENIERCGLSNAVVLNEPPQKLAAKFQAFFDKILVDAPCSGEGMFRKEPESCTQWSLDNVAMCSRRQVEILHSALAMLRPGGTLLYSTCTFAPEENEQVIEEILTTYPDLRLLPVTLPGLSPARPQWGQRSLPALKNALRFWPHLADGEGHFLALLHKEKGDQPEIRRRAANPGSIIPENLRLWQEFSAHHLTQLNLSGILQQFAEHIYLTPQELPDLAGIKVVRAGLHLGMLKKNRFEPAHALALSLKTEQSRNTIKLTDREAYSYLHGETLTISGNKGWNLIAINGYPLGWGKHDGQVLKNHYPKGLRWV